MSELDVIQETEVDPVETQPAVETETAELEAEATEVAEEPATSEPEPENPKRRSRAEERINALTREKYEAQKAAEAAQRQAAELQQYLQQQQAQPQQNEMPKLADYDYDEGRYQQAVQSWNQQQFQTYQEQQVEHQRQQHVQHQQMQEAQALQAKMAEGQTKYPDFVTKVNDPSLPPLREINPAAFQAVISSDAAVDVAYYLANNPQDVYALASMNPVQAIKSVAQIEAKVSAKQQTTAKAPPKPPTTVKGNSEAVQDPQRMTTDEWMKWRNAQLKGK